MRTLYVGLISLAAFLGLSISLTLGEAQETQAIARCRSTLGDAERLMCYDKAVDGEKQDAPATAQMGYRAIPLTDLKLDEANMTGHHVAVAGNLMLAGELGLLGSDCRDSSPLVVDMKAVPREQRRAVPDRCNDLACSVSIHGTVGQVISKPGIVADTVDVQ